MSDGQPESGEVVENPEPEADSELPGVNQAVENEGEIAEENTTDQPEDECVDLGGECEASESGQALAENSVEGENGDVDEEVTQSDCVEGEEAEGSVPFGQNSPEDSRSAAESNNFIQAASTEHNDVAESDNFNVDASQNDSNSQEETPHLPLSLESNNQGDSPQNDEVAQGVAEVANPMGGGDQVVNNGDLNTVPCPPGQHVEARDSAAPEDESPELQTPVEDGQAPECDRDFGLGIETDSSVMSQPEEQQPDVESAIDSTEDSGELPKARMNLNSDDPSNVNQLPADDSPEDAQSVETEQNPADTEDIEMGVELCEDYSEGQGSVESITVAECVESVSSPQEGESVSTESDSNSVAVSSPTQNNSAGGFPASQNKTESPKDSSQSDAVKVQHDFEDDLLSELDAELHSKSDESHQGLAEKPTESTPEPVLEQEQLNGSGSILNGLSISELSDSPQLKTIMDQLVRMQKQVEESQKKLNSHQTNQQDGK